MSTINHIPGVAIHGAMRADKPIPRGYGKSIPLPPMEFPEYDPAAPENQYPKQITRTATADDADAWIKLNKQHDPRSGSWTPGGVPRKGSPIAVLTNAEDVDAGIANSVGVPLVVHSKEAEAIARQNHADELGRIEAEPAPPARAVTVQVGGEGAVSELGQHSVPAASRAATPAPADDGAAALEASEAENDRLRAQIAAMSKPQPRKKPGPKAKAKRNATASVDD
jgi:hypothetical protein